MKQLLSPTPADRHYFHHLLSERNQQPHRVKEIDEEIRRVFEKKIAILALDMCGFSRLTARHGIIHYLSLIQQMHEATGPAVVGNGGQVIKKEADNLWAIFPAPANALEAAIDIFRSFEAINSVVDEERDIHGSIGIGFGDTLVIGDEDLYGNEMNLASKLGEDLAGQSEILLTSAAHASLPKDRYACTECTFQLAHFTILSHRFDRSVFQKPSPRQPGKRSARTRRQTTPGAMKSHKQGVAQ